MLTLNYFAVKGIIGTGQSSSQVSKRALPFIPYICHFWYATALLRPVKCTQKVRNCATKYPKLAKTGQNWPQFLVLYAKNYASLKKYAPAGGGGGD